MEEPLDRLTEVSAIVKSWVARMGSARTPMLSAKVFRYNFHPAHHIGVRHGKTSPTTNAGSYKTVRLDSVARARTIFFSEPLDTTPGIELYI